MLIDCGRGDSRATLARVGMGVGVEGASAAEAAKAAEGGAKDAEIKGVAVVVCALLGLRLGTWPAAVCISVAARHVRARRIHSATIVRLQPS